MTTFSVIAGLVFVAAVGFLVHRLSKRKSASAPGVGPGSAADPRDVPKQTEVR